MTTTKRVFGCLVSVLAYLNSGCTPQLPPVVPVSGTVYLDNKPLAFARIEFIPMLEHFGAETNSGAVTDENGHFTLLCSHKQQSGAVVATHKVLVIEHIPDDMRGMDGKSQHRLGLYQADLKNRPIPELYGIASRTPLSVDVKAGQETYDLQLTSQK